MLACHKKTAVRLRRTAVVKTQCFAPPQITLQSYLVAEIVVVTNSPLGAVTVTLLAVASATQTS